MIISQRYERGATLITSNLPFEEWTETFGSERLTGALLDRLTHHINKYVDLDYEAWEHWHMNGSRDLQTRARVKAEKLLADYQAPEMDIAIKEALDSFVEKRQEEISPSLA